jgi:hypothetical protein
MSVQTDLQDQLAEWRYRTRTSAVWAGGNVLRTLTGTSVSSLVCEAEAINSLDTYMLGSVGIGLSIGVKVYIANQEHSQQIRRLTSFYRNEIGTYLGLAPEEVGEDELKLAAKEIPSLQDALERNDKRRMVKMTAWIGGTVLAGALLLTVGTTLVPALVGMIPMLTATSTLLPLMNSLAAAAIGTGAMYFGSEMLEKIGKVVAGTKDPTAHDMTREIAHQLAEDPPYPVSSKQVFEVFLAANQGLADELSRQLGRKFEKLDSLTQETVLRQYEPILKMQSLANDLNNKQIRPQELMFRVVGRESGIPRLPEPPRTQAERLEMQVQHGWQHGREKAGVLMEEGMQRAQKIRQRAGEKISNARASLREGGWRAILNRGNASAPQQGEWVTHTQSSPSAGEISR